jgi:ribosomal protein L21E
VGDHTYYEGKVVNIRATPAFGWQFDMWIGDVGTVDDVTEASTTITMDDDYYITASFVEL